MNYTPEQKAAWDRVMQILKDLHRQGLTIVVVTHDSGVAHQAEKIVHIMDGNIERIEENLH